MTRPGRAGYGPALQVLVALILGVAVGVLAAETASPRLARVVRVLEPAGVLFVNAIRMTVVPLVMAMLITGVASVSHSGLLARLGLRSLGLGLSFALVIAGFTMVVAQPVLSRLAIDPAAAASLRAAALVETRSTPAGTSVVQWITDLVPANPVKALADGSMLPLIVFTLGFAVAITRLPAHRQASLLRFFRALLDAMLVLVGWVIRLAPFGVFALAVPLAARMGGGVAGALLTYVLLAVTLTVAALALIVYPAAGVLGRVGVLRFARAAAPAQAVALSSRSTMASLPAMIDAARTLAVPEPVVAFVVPLAASTLRAGSAVGQTVAVLFAARLFDIHLAPMQLVTILVTTVLTTFTVPGVPGGSIVAMVPILLAAGIPAGAIGVLLGADVIPDMVRTMANVTGGIAAAAIVGRGGSLPTAPAEPYTP